MSEVATEWVVPCPTCDAAIGEPCVDRGAFGTPVGSSGWHITRWNAFHEQASPAHIDQVQALTRARLHEALTQARLEVAAAAPSAAGGRRPLGWARVELAHRLASISAMLAELAVDPGRTQGVLPTADAEHLEALSDHLALCSAAVRNSRGPLSELTRKLW